MELRARIRPFARRAAITAALGVFLVPVAAGPATADAAKRSKTKRYPVVTSVRPMDADVGDTLVIRGRNFKRGRDKNTVVFKRDGARAVFVKTTLGTAKQISVVVPDSLRAMMAERTPTRFRLRVLSQRFSKRFTADSRSPVLTALPKPAAATPAAPSGSAPTGTTATPSTPAPPAPPAPPRVCSGDEDGDMLASALEDELGLDSCNADTDGDGVPDGYEYQSAIDLNDDEYQGPNTNLPYPGKRPYPNPLFADAGSDHDGDSLPLLQEFRLWERYGARPSGTLPESSFRLLYSAGELYSLSARDGTGRRRPSQPASTYPKFAAFLSWASAAGYQPVTLSVDAPWHDAANQVAFDLRDVNRNGAVDGAGRPAYLDAEDSPYDFDGDGYISDDERDEDADGLTNFDELTGRMTSAYWAACYSKEKPYTVTYAGTDLTDPDSDGDGVRDGADDQDHDDIPNFMELSRNMASGHSDWGLKGMCNTDETLVGPDGPDADLLPDPITVWHQSDYGRVNPYNPCLPFTWSRTCERHPVIGAGPAPFDGSTDWFALQ